MMRNNRNRSQQSSPPRAAATPAAGTSTVRTRTRKFTSALLLVPFLFVIIMNYQYLNNNQTSGMTPAIRGERSTLLSDALSNTPIGSLGPKNTNRLHYRYYDSLFYTAIQFGSEAKSTIEVGCASDPFLKYLTWVPKRTCVAPYFTSYGDGKGKESVQGSIQSVKANFMEYELPDNEKFDLLICSQVVEHVGDSKAFVQKLINSAETSIISVPYKWNDCGKQCNHKSDKISYDTILEWSYPHVPVMSTIVHEDREKKVYHRRIIVVFKLDVEEDA